MAATSMAAEMVGKLIVYNHTFILKKPIGIRLICCNADVRCYRVN